METQDGVRVAIDNADSRPLIAGDRAGDGSSGHRYGVTGADLQVTATEKGGFQLDVIPGSTAAAGAVKYSTNYSTNYTVFVQVVFMKLGEIDTVKETFTADVFVQARWREPKLDGSQMAKDTDPDKVNWDKFWNPKLYIHNGIGSLQETITRTIIYDTDTWQAYVAERRRVKGTFIENLELFAFPFDTQDITIKVASERSDEELQLQDDPVNVSTINTDMFIDEQEWRLYKEVATHREAIEAVFDGNVARTATHTAVCCRTHACRRPGFYVTNILLVMLFIYSLTFATFAVDYLKRENRLQLTFILLLTTIAFKNTTSSSLPRISYFTTLDIYIVLSMSVLVLVCIWHAIVTTISLSFGASVAQTSDTAVLITFGVLYALVQLIFAVAVAIPFMNRKRMYIEKEQAHKRQIQDIKLAGPRSTLQDIRNLTIL
jgi:hypothetical protein